MLATMDAAARRRAIEFLSRIENHCAEAVMPCTGGHAVLDTRHPALWSANHIRVEAAPAPGAAQLDEAAATYLDPLPFRMIAVVDEVAGLALAQPLAALGYSPAHELLMVLEDDRCAEESDRVVALSRRLFDATRIDAQIEADRDVEVGMQLASRDALIAELAFVRRRAVMADGEVAARVQIYRDHAIAQIENLYTAPAHRRQGLARLLMRHAIAEARAGGAELVFLVADAADWPQDFYARLGFAAAGLLPRYLRLAG
jgi:ribosomal protein S18 acetylase RimI-like enzyme